MRVRASAPSLCPGTHLREAEDLGSALSLTAQGTGTAVPGKPMPSSDLRGTRRGHGADIRRGVHRMAHVLSVLSFLSFFFPFVSFLDQENGILAVSIPKALLSFFKFKTM